MQVNARNFAAQVHVLWIIPGTTCAQAGEHKAIHLEAYRSKFAAWRARAEYSNTIEYEWADLKAKAIKFCKAAPKDNYPLLERNAPRKAWVVADVTNGSYYEDDGRVWVFVFKTRQAARDYVAAAKAATPNCIQFSAPTLMYQHAN